MKKIDWTNHLINIIVVVASILLAFALNTFYENSKERNKANIQIEGIKKEIKENKITIDTALQYHYGLLQKLRKSSEDVSIVIKSADLKSNAWLIAERNSVNEYISYEIYKELTDIYTLQKGLETHNNSIGNYMNYLNIVGPYHMLPMADKEFDYQAFADYKKNGWVPIFEDVTYYESELSKMYEAILKKLD